MEGGNNTGGGGTRNPNRGLACSDSREAGYARAERSGWVAA